MISHSILTRRHFSHATLPLLLLFVVLLTNGTRALAEQRLEADEPFRKILLQDKILAKQGGVRVTDAKDGGFVIVTVAFTSNKDPIQRRSVAKANAIAKLVTYLEGIDVDGDTSVKDTTLTNEKDGDTTQATETIWKEKIIFRVQGVVNVLPIVATWTNDTGEFYMALGAVFDADGNPILTNTKVAHAEVTVQAEGVSDSPDGAKRALVLDAVSRVTSTFLMQKQEVSGEEIDEKIATFSDGVVKSMAISRGPTKGSDGLYRVSGSVVVIRKNLVDSLRKENLSISGTLRSDDLFARAVSMEALRKNSGELLEMLFEEDPRRYSVRLFGEIKVVPATQLTEQEVKSGGINWMQAVVSVSADVKAYRDEYASRLEKVLVSISESNARYESGFSTLTTPTGFVYPRFNTTSEVNQSIKEGFTNLSFGAVTDSWKPLQNTEHIYRHLFIQNNTVFKKKVAQLPVFSSKVKWTVSTKERPFVGYNVMMIGTDINGYPTLHGYAITPAFFSPFEKLLNDYEKNRNKEGSVVVSLNLIRKDGTVLKRLDHPLPRGHWLTPGYYAGRPKSDEKNKRVVLMPIGMAPGFCDAMKVQQVRSRAGIVNAQQSIISSFSTISNASATFRFPLDPADMKTVSEVRVSTHLSGE